MHLVALVIATLFGFAHPVKALAGERPNIILIMADDLGYGSLGCYGNAEIKTPHIDALAAAGMRFTDFHSNGPMCSPTRAALLTGRYPQRCAWVADKELSPVFQQQRKENLKQRWAWGISPQEWTISRQLEQADYATALIGKWHLGYDLNFHPLNYGFDEFRGFVGGNVDYHTHVAEFGMQQVDWWHAKNIKNENGYTTDLLSSYATDFIERNKDRPFFLYLTHAAPHSPWQGRDPNKKQSPAATYREMIEVLDESVGAIVSEVHKHQLEKKTLVIFCSDNGAAPPRGVPANGRWKGKKGDLTEGGHRVPCIASWPGVIAAGSLQHEPVMSMDFLPTFAALTGTTFPDQHVVDGIDLMPMLKGETKPPERVLHWLFGNAWVIRQGSWKLSGKKQNAMTLVNLENDPEEKRNLIKDHASRVSEMMKLHLQWIQSVGNQ